MQRQNLEERAEKTLRDTDAYQVPVPIHLVAQCLNLTLEAATLGDKVSGLLVVQGDRARIGYNAAHARVRQRFTISHPLQGAAKDRDRQGAHRRRHQRPRPSALQVLQISPSQGVPSSR